MQKRRALEIIFFRASIYYRIYKKINLLRTMGREDREQDREMCQQLSEVAPR
jgi:hypothetical protein